MGLQKGIQAAVLGQKDPAWKLKFQQAQSAAWATEASMQEAFLKLGQAKNEMQAWTTDLPKINSYVEALKTDPNAVPPAVSSMRGMQQIEQLSNRAAQIDLSRQRLDLQKETSRLALSAAENLRSWESAVSGSDPATSASIRALGKDAYTYDINGRPNGPSPQALDLYNSWATDNGKEPTRRFGYKATAADAARERAKQPASPLGKLQSDRQRAVDEGQPEEVIAAYDAAIKKATETGGLYSEKPEVITVQGKQFLKWGKQLRDLTGSSAQDKAQIGIMTDRIKKLQDALIKSPEDDQKRILPNSLTSQLLDARQKFQRFFKTQATTATPSNLPMTPADKSGAVAQPIPSSPTGISFDDFEKWKQDQ